MSEHDHKDSSHGFHLLVQTQHARARALLGPSEWQPFCNPQSLICCLSKERKDHCNMAALACVINVLLHCEIHELFSFFVVVEMIGFS